MGFSLLTSLDAALRTQTEPRSGEPHCTFQIATCQHLGWTLSLDRQTLAEAPNTLQLSPLKIHPVSCCFLHCETATFSKMSLNRLSGSRKVYYGLFQGNSTASP